MYLDEKIVKLNNDKYGYSVLNPNGGLVSSDSSGRGKYIGVFSETLSTDVYDTIMAQFSYGLSDFDLDLDGKVENNGGTISIQDSNLLTASAGTNTAGEASVESKEQIRYRAGKTGVVKFTAQFHNYENTDGEAWIGPYNGKNGYRIGYKDGIFTFQTLKNDVVSKEVTKDEFNGNYKYDNLNPGSLNIYRITYGYLGSAPCTLEVLGKNEINWYVLHTFHYNDDGGTNIELPYLPIKMEAKNSGNNTAIQVRCGSINAGSMGMDKSASTRYFNTDEFIATTNEAEEPIITFKNKDTFNSKVNHITGEAVRLNSITDISDVVRIRFIKNATLTGASFTDVDTTNSTHQTDTSATAYTGGDLVYTIYISGSTGTGSNSGALGGQTDLGDLGLKLLPGEQITISSERLTNSGSYNLGLAINWRELF